VVIATNIAGRGTDFKTSDELEKNGGLQVCVAFLPCNKRVEDQAFGRTARQGNNGTAKLMIKKSEVKKLSISSNSLEEIKRVRDLKEQERIKQIKEVKILELQFQDRLFEHFSSLYRRLKKEDKSEGEYH
jgi:preprotein translocase subunit SecA